MDGHNARHLIAFSAGIGCSVRFSEDLRAANYFLSSCDGKGQLTLIQTIESGIINRYFSAAFNGDVLRRGSQFRQSVARILRVADTIVVVIPNVCSLTRTVENEHIHFGTCVAVVARSAGRKAIAQGIRVTGYVVIQASESDGL